MTSLDTVKTLGILLFPKFESLDVFGPIELFGMLEDRLKIVMISEQGGLIPSVQGQLIHTEFTIDNAPHLDMLLVPGGLGTRKEVKNQALIAWLKRTAPTLELLLSVCTGAALLAKAELLDGLKATSNKEAFAWVKEQSSKVQWIKEARWVDAGHIITSAGISAGLDMSLYVISRLYGESMRDEVAKRAEYQVSKDANWDPFCKNLEKTLNSTIAALASMVEQRDPYTAGHQRHVADLAVAIAKEMKLSAERITGLRMACVVHDIGKIQVPAEILSKPSQISAAEFEILKTHPKAGFDVLKNIDFPWPVAEIVYQHHERLDGSGYPRGLKGEELLLETRILTVADVVDAMSSHRPYRPALGILAALKEIMQQRGILYDAQVVDACIKLFIEDNYQIK